ncbi:hypothetical protein ITX31_07925 [Arthrobacter gandavensis]|uniref:hypothetical protein n=1 Tax=Arthrobacter gandavensis TaxID=169960 RepID=UPI00188E0CD3|nr:hypothetical protein [Arthrobacter gandavensis]MBF4994036.1 hypothetical protein [Arthrobacter gandavensis]
MAGRETPERTRLRPAAETASTPGLAAHLLVPILLGLLGFCAVAAAVASTGGALGITVSGLGVVLTLLAAAAAAPRYLPVALEGRPGRPLAVLAGVALAHFLLFWTAGSTVFLTLPAFPVAAAGGCLLLATSLWSQFRRGPASDEPVRVTGAAARRPFAHTLVLVLANWVFFAAAGMFSAWILLGR